MILKLSLSVDNSGNVHCQYLCPLISLLLSSVKCFMVATPVS